MRRHDELRGDARSTTRDDEFSRSSTMVTIADAIAAPAVVRPQLTMRDLMTTRKRGSSLRSAHPPAARDGRVRAPSSTVGTPVRGRRGQRQRRTRRGRTRCSPNSSSPIAARSPAGSSRPRRRMGIAHRRGLFRCRPRGAACADGRRGGAYRRRRRPRQSYIVDRQDHRRLPGRPAPRRCIRATASCRENADVRRRRWRRRASSSSARRSRPIEAMGDKITSKKLAAEAGRLDRARPYGPDRRRRRGGDDRRGRSAIR